MELIYAILCIAAGFSLIAYCIHLNIRERRSFNKYRHKLTIYMENMDKLDVPLEVVIANIENLSSEKELDRANKELKKSLRKHKL